MAGYGTSHSLSDQALAAPTTTTTVAPTTTTTGSLGARCSCRRYALGAPTPGFAGGTFPKGGLIAAA
ncbi:MAG: hypothetical protein U9N84_01715, partial [Actinomycetota bacterium]|nr:hypothetical protein [Actinomycetota bacterium]